MLKSRASSGQKVQSNCTDGGAFVHQLVDQLFEAGAASKCETCKALESPAFRITNQQDGGSNPSGRATILNAYFLVKLLLRGLSYAVRY